MPNLHVVVDGRVLDDPDSALAGDGQFPPFHLFVPDAQSYLEGSYASRELAQAEADRINGGEYVAPTVPDEPEDDAPWPAMHLYKFSFERDYVEREGFERIIRAPSLPEAQAAAENLASQFNHDCPDDCSDTGRGSGGGEFEAECVSAEVHKQSEPDYVVLPDGQCVPYGDDDDSSEEDQLNARQDVQRVEPMKDGWRVTDDTGAVKIGTFAEIVAWLNAGLD